MHAAPRNGEGGRLVPAPLSIPNHLSLSLSLFLSTVPLPHVNAFLSDLLGPYRTSFAQSFSYYYTSLTSMILH